jgi:hypothetical protein
MTYENYRQKGLFEYDLSQGELDFEYTEDFIDEYAPKEDDSQHRRDAELIERADRELEPLVGPHLAIDQYYENRLQMISEVCAANRGLYFVAKNTTRDGFAQTVEQYGGVAEANAVDKNTGRRAFHLQKRMDRLFLVDELIMAGFAAEAVRGAAKQTTAELKAEFTGTYNKKHRTDERRRLKRRLQEVKEL